MTPDPLLALVAQAAPLPARDADAIRRAWGAPREVRAGDVLLAPGAVCRSLWFQDAGVARFYAESKPAPAEADDADVTRHFVRPATYYTVVASLSTGTPSREGVQMLTDGAVRRISREANERLAADVPAWDAFRQRTVRRVYDDIDRFTDALRSLTAAERYAAFERDYADVLLAVPLRYVASYLGVTPQSLSRVRARRPRAGG